MILALLDDPHLRSALRRAAAPDEDVLANAAVVALDPSQVFPHLLVHDEKGTEAAARILTGASIPTLVLDRGWVARWDEQRRASGLLLSRADHAYIELRPLLRENRRPHWVDYTLRDLSRAAGATLPPPLRGFARRVLEFPARYDDLRGVGTLAGLSRGAMKARFRRRGLASPYLHVRWLRCIAAAQLLSDPSLKTMQVSQRLGFTSDGNFCRSVLATAGVPPTALRSRKGWHLLVTGFATRFLGPLALEGWISLEQLFLRRAA